jgi:hypothetical protein
MEIMDVMEDGLNLLSIMLEIMVLHLIPLTEKDMKLKLILAKNILPFIELQELSMLLKILNHN